MSDNSHPVSFRISPRFREEIDRITLCTDLESDDEVFRRAFTLLRIHVDAEKEGKMVTIAHPDRPDEKLLITLPFQVWS